MRHHHIIRDGMGFCIHHALNFTDDCDECIAEDKAKRAATHCETHDETFETVCPQCAMWKANILDQDAQEITTMPEALDPVALGVRADWLLEAQARRFVDPSDKLGDGFIRFRGQQNPLPPDTFVVVEDTDGEMTADTAGMIPWSRIVSYKIIEQEGLVSSEPQSALQVQEGGDHYKKLKIQPVEYIHANGLPFAEGSVIKYVTRWRDKNGIADLKKARHFLDLLIELEGAK
jgi:hypothetical protein